MGSKKKGFDGSRDIISGLPDAMICHILSFLPAKEAASTTVLAKRWKPLLAFVPNLDFDPLMTVEERRQSSESFMLFVDGVLALQAEENAPLNRFHVKCEDVDQNAVLEWIPKVLKRGVLDIDLHMPYSSRHFRPNSVFYPLPSEIFTSKKLVRLKIQFKDGIKIDVEGDVSLPKLKTLHLDYVKIGTRMFQKLLSGCHAIEELLLFNLIWEESSEPEPCLVTVSAPTLKILKFSRFENFIKVKDFKPILLLSFDFPKLVYLEYLDTIADMYQQVSFDSLVEAKLGLCKNPKQIKDDKNNVTKLFMGICNVKILHLTEDALRVLACCRETMPVFENLIQLTISTGLHVGWKSLPPLLQNSPNLQTLVFEGLHHKYKKRYERDCGHEDRRCICKGQDNMRVKKDIDACLSSSPVKIIKILNYGKNSDVEEDVADQLKQVKQFLETMPELEQVILYYNTSNDEDVMKVCMKLQKLRRVASAKCEIQIISDKLTLSMIMGTNL
ncbi:F-box domain [Arabidopsis suecica]|uniref:F-box domain n=1 Tax=Arabidopsis suecica TaxID=45249 RepID=A0A8T1YRS0_ARASU|nr:F-box domain [Arabidopsis suecica]